jgi:hypothetical protein
MTQAKFAIWLMTFVDEKDFDTDMTFEIEGPSGTNMMDYNVVCQAMLDAPANEQAAIKSTLVEIDFKNGDIGHFFRHLAKALAI